MTNEVPAAARAAVGERGATSGLVKWLGAFAPLLVVAGAFLLLWPTAHSLIVEWRDDAHTTTYTHGWLIGALCLWMLFRDRERLMRSAAGPSGAAFVLLLAASLVWLVAVRAGIQTVHQVLMPVMMWLAVCAAFGVRTAGSSSFAIGYLYFAIPVWGHLNEALQMATVVAVEFLLRLSGVTMYVEGVFVYIPEGTIEIAAGCSGLHYFIVAIAIAALYGEVSRDPWRVRAKQMVLAISLALVSNWVRVYIIIMAGHLTAMKHPLVSESHYTFGWYVFAASMLIFFLIARRMDAPAAVDTGGRASQALGMRASPASTLGKGIAFAAAGLLAAPLWNLAASTAASDGAKFAKSLPRDLPNWQGPSSTAESHTWAPVYLGADAVERGRYSQGDRAVDVYTAIYLRQEQGKELIGHRNDVLGERPQRVLERSVVDVDGPVQELAVQNAAGERDLLWYFYSIGSQQTTRGIAAQLWYGWSSLFGAPESRVIALRTTCAQDCESARTSLRAWLEDAQLRGS